MKRKILISENELVSLIKNQIMEQNQSIDPNEYGCYKLTKGSPNYEWCDNSIQYIQKNIEKIKNIVKVAEKLLKKEENKHLKHNIKFFEENDEFFSQNLENLEILKRSIPDCKSGIEYINRFKKNLSGKAIFVHKIGEKYEYSLLNKLNTNYSALAFLLNKYRLKNNLNDLTTEQIFKKYFNDGKFLKFLINYFEKSEYEMELMKEIFRTISNTSKKGRETEIAAIKVLKDKFGSENVIDFAGDYSFVDMLGVDVLVFSKNLKEWVPVQIKTRETDCIGNYRFFRW